MAEQTISFQAGHQKKCLGTERRAWVRLPASQEVFCQPAASLTTDESEFGWSGQVRDISLGGIGLVLGRRFERGTVLIVELTTEAEETRRLLVRVVHATPETEGRWIIGCVLACRLSQRDLQTFLR